MNEIPERMSQENEASRRNLDSSPVRRSVDKKSEVYLGSNMESSLEGRGLGDQGSVGESEGISEGKDSARLKKMSGHEQIRAYIEGFDEMIKFMDFSFERAFQQKDKEFMLAYRDHIKMI